MAPAFSGKEMVVRPPCLLIARESWIEWPAEKQLQILPLRVRMTAVAMVGPTGSDFVLWSWEGRRLATVLHP
jgi:hypothetical protein